MDPIEFVKGWKPIRSPQRRPLLVVDLRKHCSKLVIDGRHRPLQRLRNDAMAYLILMTVSSRLLAHGLPALV